MTQDRLTAALQYAKRGWAVFPCNGKLPRIANGFKAASTSTKQIRKWWARWPEANIGIACSSQRGPIVVDIDGQSGADFLATLGLDETREATTGKPVKRHLYFEPTLDGDKVKRLIRPFNRKGRYVDLDILGDGGYVVAPPSIHPLTHRRYQWVRKTRPERFPAELLEAIANRKNGHQQSFPLPEIIGEGERDNLLTSLAGTMRRRNSSPEAILAALREENRTRVNPPLPDRDLRRIAKSIGEKPPAFSYEHLTDLGNARRFIFQHEEMVRSIMANRKPWMLWDDTRWTPDTTGEVERFAKQTVRRIYAEAAQVADEEKRDTVLKHAVKSESAPRLRAMLELASTEPELCTRPEQLDGNPWLFNVRNGTVDLRTGELRPPNRTDLITKLAPVEFDAQATAPRWKKFLREIMCGDEELVEFLQRAVGYALTGDTREECLFFCYGKGSNGKSTLFETLRTLFGEYARQSDFSTFLSSRGEGPRNDIARMHGARLVTASEADSERGFDGRIIKLLTGADTIVARKLYEEHTEFKPQHKLFLAANHKPVVKEQTEGLWRRMRLIPFTAVFTKEQRDKRLGARLVKELPGILNWAIDGCVKWRASGLLEPSAVKAATQSYREENDLLGEFIAHTCKLDEDAWSSTPELYHALTDWWTETRGPRSQPISMAWFGRLLGERTDLKSSKKGRLRGWKGLAIKATAPRG